ncbi:hypothetical protein [Flexivirga meconopsidis]|uniref:hypothetical protein n=1 Tax=Flexivirga meconopsidis TaxID=2977121 RepID=UPI00223FD6B1|nr:hypothetical protein [Flexivirga meconopsidis]
MTSASTSPLTALAGLPGVSDAVDRAREACTQLRWHNALRRRVPEASAESRVRGARASALLEGAEFPVDLVRDVMRGADEAPGGDARGAALQGAIQATAQTEQLLSVVRTAPAQALARLHTAAAAGLVPDDALGRPRMTGERVAELTELGPAPDAAQAAARLRGVVDLIASSAGAPGVLVAAVAHAEIASARPFVHGNALVARALERLLLQSTGVDPTGTVVIEAGRARESAAGYQGALAAYSSGGSEGVRLWLEHSAEAVVAGAAEATRICDAVLAGRLTPRP